jgi:hypothetical protein
MSALLLMVAPTVQPKHAAAEPLPAPAASAEAAAVVSQEEKKDAKLTLQVKGRVVDRNGKGLASIEVTVEGPNGTVPKRTDSSGAYKFEGPPGKYNITAKAGDKKATIAVNIDKSMELQALVLNTED